MLKLTRNSRYNVTGGKNAVSGNIGQKKYDFLISILFFVEPTVVLAF